MHDCSRRNECIVDWAWVWNVEPGRLQSNRFINSQQTLEEHCPNTGLQPVPQRIPGHGITALGSQNANLQLVENDAGDIRYTRVDALCPPGNVDICPPRSDLTQF